MLAGHADIGTTANMARLVHRAVWQARVFEAASPPTMHGGRRKLACALIPDDAYGAPKGQTFRSLHRVPATPTSRPSSPARGGGRS
jgi:hypothetical protein